MEEYLLEMKNIHKRFPGVYALKGVDLTLKAGEVMALVGEMVQENQQLSISLAVSIQGMREKS